MPLFPLRLRAAVVALVVSIPVLGACAGEARPGAGPGRPVPVLHVGAIPDQDPDKLQRLYATLADHLARELDVDVEYVPVTDYAAAVTLFRTGDLDLVWFGGLTGVQARLQTRGALPVAQRDIDADFHSVFIANAGAGLSPIDDVAGLAALAGRRFTFGSESSTSGRLMPQFFLSQAGVEESDFAGPPGFSGSHDKTIELVASGAFEAGVVNEEVLRSRLADGSVDPTKVVELLRTPPYHDYHWLLRPDAERRFGKGFSRKVEESLLGLDEAGPDGAAILDLFGATRFVATTASNYDDIEAIARKLGLVS